MEYKPAYLFGITMVKIAVQKVGKSLYEAFIKAIGLLEDAELSPQDRVLIKPNIVEPVPPKTRSITNPYLVDPLAIVQKGLRQKQLSPKGVLHDLAHSIESMRGF